MTLQVRKKKETGHFLQCVTCLLPGELWTRRRPKGGAGPEAICWFPGTEPPQKETDWLVKRRLFFRCYNLTAWPCWQGPRAGTCFSQRSVFASRWGLAWWGEQPRCTSRGLASSAPGRKAGVSWEERGLGERLWCFKRHTYHWITIFQILTRECLKILITENHTEVTWGIFLTNRERSWYLRSVNRERTVHLVPFINWRRMVGLPKAK